MSDDTARHQVNGAQVERGRQARERFERTSPVRPDREAHRAREGIPRLGLGLPSVVRRTAVAAPLGERPTSHPGQLSVAGCLRASGRVGR
ncbi:DUF6192 family protein [Streptomyces sp. NBC_01794]|uniref:DUF6192 family protein n=1 Tax=unclassified Streptomyces TaxID=2593676 RepID=UPI0038735AA4